MKSTLSLPTPAFFSRENAKLVMLMLAVLCVFLLLPNAAHAAEGTGGGLPYEGWLTNLRNSITVFVQGDEAFIGVSRSARSKDGASMVDLAKLHEFGGPPVIIPMTPKMRRFLFALLRQAGKEPTGGNGRGVIVVQVPARPFLRPAFDKFREGASRRFLERVARELGLAP